MLVGPGINGSNADIHASFGREVEQKVGLKAVKG